MPWLFDNKVMLFCFNMKLAKFLVQCWPSREVEVGVNVCFNAAL